MDDQLPLRELETLWRLAGRVLVDPVAEVDPKFQTIRPRVFALLLEMLMVELEQEPPEVPPTLDDLAVLLSSTNARIRLLGIRLTTLRGG